MKQRLKEEGLTGHSRAIIKYRSAKTLRKAESKRKGKQLNPADFTKYMGVQQRNHDPIKPRRLNVDISIYYNRKFRRRRRRAIMVMKRVSLLYNLQVDVVHSNHLIVRNKAVGLDNIHLEIMQTVKVLFKRVLNKWCGIAGAPKVMP